MNDAEKRAYQRGYHRGARWPEHLPPLPPEQHVAKLMKAAERLRNAVDGEMATFEKDDELALKLYVYVDEVDEALAEIGAWLLSEHQACVATSGREEESEEGDE